MYQLLLGLVRGTSEFPLPLPDWDIGFPIWGFGSVPESELGTRGNVCPFWGLIRCDKLPSTVVALTSSVRGSPADEP